MSKQNIWKQRQGQSTGNSLEMATQPRMRQDEADDDVMYYDSNEMVSSTVTVQRIPPNVNQDTGQLSSFENFEKALGMSESDQQQQFYEYEFAPDGVIKQINPDNVQQQHQQFDYG